MNKKRIAIKLIRRAAELIKEAALMRTAPEDKRPPKEWWENCITRARKFADNPEKFCGALWHRPEDFPYGEALKESFGEPYKSKKSALRSRRALRRTEGKYCAALFAPDGDYVTDFYGNTVEEVWKQLADRGSMWFFYPIETVIKTKTKKIADATEVVDDWIGKTADELSEFLAGLTDEERSDLLGIPLEENEE